MRESHAKCVRLGRSDPSLPQCVRLIAVEWGGGAKSGWWSPRPRQVTHFHFTKSQDSGLSKFQCMARGGYLERS